jgi:cell division protein ZapA (FtsZ GTPase activity inhibitor)
MEEKHRVKISFAGKEYSFQMISPDDEADMRSAAKKISQRMDMYKEKFANLADNDALAISSLMFVAQMIKEKRNESSEAFIEEINGLNDRLQEYIANNIDD